MARLAKTVVEQREAEVLEAFKAGASVKQANEALQAKYGSKMNLKRIYALRQQVRDAGKPVDVSTEPVAAVVEAAPEVAAEPTVSLS